jgi:DNA-binding IclR family transcriptional regulator
VLRAISVTEPRGARTADLARSTGLARPTAHRLLTALLAEGLVDRDTAGQWRLGPELYLLGTAAAARYDVTALAQPAVRRLAVASGESAFYSTRRGDETVCLLREEGSFPLRSHVLHEGVRFPLGVASDLVGVYGPAHAAAPLQARIADTRHAGYAVNPGLIVEGSWGMAATVFNARAEPVGALSLTGVEHRFAAHRRPHLGRLLLAEAHRLSTALG